MSESIAVQCGQCGQKLAAPLKLAGRRVACPKCKAPVDVPAPLPVAEVVAEPPNLGGLFDEEFSLGPLPAAPGHGGPPPLPAATPLPAPTTGRTLPALPSAAPTSRPAARGNRKSIIAFVAVIGACCLVGGGFAAYMLMGGRGVGNDLSYLPDDADVVMSMDVHGLMGSGAAAKLKAAAPQLFQQMDREIEKTGSKFKPDDIGRVTIGVNVAGQHFAGVIHFNRPMLDGDLNKPGQTSVKKKAGSYEIVIEDDGKTAHCQLDSYTFAIGSEAAMTAVLQRGGSATLAPDLAAAMKEVDFGHGFAVAVSSAAWRNGPAGQMAGGMTMMPGGPDGVRGAALHADVDNDIRLQAALLCKDATVADQLKKMADGGLAVAKANTSLPPASAKIMNSVSVSNSGNIVSASMAIDSETIGTLLSSIPLGAGLPGQASPFGGGDSPPAQSPLVPHAPQAPRAPIAPRPNNSFGPPKIGSGGGNAIEAAWRAQSSNNLKQIGLALLNAENKDGHFPPPAICDAAGKPLLSWRVAILPYLHEEKLYKEFDLTEPWDSPKNKRLVVRMPRVYRVLGAKVHGIGNTCYLAPVGENAAFFGPQGRKVSDFQRGLSKTYFIVEAAPDRAVPWTKPDDLTVNESNPSDGLLGQRDGGFLALYGDGHVELVPASSSADWLRGYFHLVGDTPAP
jgi:hypothetical protein